MLLMQMLTQALLCAECYYISTAAIFYFTKVKFVGVVYIVHVLSEMIFPMLRLEIFASAIFAAPTQEMIGRVLCLVPSEICYSTIASLGIFAIRVLANMRACLL